MYDRYNYNSINLSFLFVIKIQKKFAESHTKFYRKTRFCEALLYYSK